MKRKRDGDIYKRISIEGVDFELRYGYYEAYERVSGDPLPIYPDFKSAPRYTADGIPFVTAMQDVCDGFSGDDGELGCYGCRYFEEREDLIGLCNFEPNRQSNGSES